MPDHADRSIRSAQAGLAVNALLVVIKLLAGIVGNTYALVADAAESTTDILSSIVVWIGLHISALPADEDHPFGHGKAEPIAAAVVALMLIGAAIGIVIVAIREVSQPGPPPATWTLAVAGAVIAIKEIMFRRVRAVAQEEGSVVVAADAWHHRSDAISSVAAFVGIGLALVGGPRWAAADDWAALIAAAVILINGVHILRPAIHDLMDRMPGAEILDPVSEAARSVPGVLAIEKLMVRRAGTGYHVDLHVQSNPELSLHDAHILSGRVKTAIRESVPRVLGVLIHMEPYEPHESGSSH